MVSSVSGEGGLIVGTRNELSGRYHRIGEKSRAFPHSSQCANEAVKAVFYVPNRSGLAKRSEAVD